MSTAIFAGSFDPFTLGHLDILERGCKMFDKVIVAVGDNYHKLGKSNHEDRIKLIIECTKHLNVEVKSCKGLMVDFAKANGANVMLRGIRNSIDFEYEKTLEAENRMLNPNIETVYIISKPELSHISSSAVREIMGFKRDVSSLVPEPVNKYLNNL